MPNPNVREDTLRLALSIRSAYVLLVQNDRPPSSVLLRWVASELERLAMEANHLADECDDDPCAGAIPGFDQTRDT